jgi:hypothetical protein
MAGKHQHDEEQCPNIAADPEEGQQEDQEQLKASLATARRDRSVADESAKSAKADLAGRIEAVADRLEVLNERFGSEAKPPVKTKKRP